MSHDLRRLIDLIEAQESASPLERHSVPLAEGSGRVMPTFANGWWVLPDGRVEECPTIGSHLETARRILGRSEPNAVEVLKGQGGIRSAVFWTPNPSQPVSMNIDLNPEAVGAAAKRGLLRLMAQTRDLFDGYYFEHLWTARQDNGQRDYREAVGEIRSLRLMEAR
jgi:hypothetical protein